MVQSPPDPSFAGLVARARAAHPSFAVDAEAFALHLGAFAAAGAVPSHVEDLYLAFACAQRDRHALALFERSHLALVGQFIAQLREQPSFVDEVRQRLRERLLVGGGGPKPRPEALLGYSGRGPLAAWLRVAAMRQALDLLAAAKARHATEEPEEDLLAATVDPELIALRQRHLPQVQAAFRGALLSLDAAERNLLRLHLVDGLNIARIGEIFGKSRATIGRMMIECRGKLLEETRRNLRSLTGTSEDEVRSLLRALHSQLDVSIRGFLIREAGPG